MQKSIHHCVYFSPIVVIVLLLLSAGCTSYNSDSSFPGVTGPSPVYSITSLGTLGGSTSRGLGISENGCVAGVSDMSDGTQEAFMVASGQGMVELPTPGGTYGLAFDANSNGYITGQAKNASGLMRAVLWQGQAQPQDLGVLKGDSEAYGYALNDTQAVVGFSRSAAQKDTAFIWDAAQGMHSLGTLGGQNSQAYFINESSIVVGYAQNHAGLDRAFVWQKDLGMSELSGFEGEKTYALKINDNDTIVGFAQDSTGNNRALLWMGSDVVSDLGTLGGKSAIAYSINNSGIITGMSYDSDNSQRAFIWYQGLMVDLNSYISSSDGWVLTYARAINDKGMITGYGTYQGRMCAFLMTPR
ncbi:MAG: hypothetical protein AB9903_26910 [Vulcanimicrobiota bacterium]